MFDLQNGPTDAQIEEFIRDGKLGAYLTGEGAFTPPRPHPQYDYNRWNRLADYYRQLGDDTKTQQIIRDTICEMFDSPGLAAKITSLTLSRILRIREIRPKVIAFVEHANIDEIPSAVRTELLLLAKTLGIEELKNEWSKLPGTPFDA